MTPNTIAAHVTVKDIVGSLLGSTRIIRYTMNDIKPTTIQNQRDRDRSMSKKETNLTPKETTTAVESRQPETVFLPSTDLYEKDDGWVLEADLPGVTQADLDIEFERGVLTLQAKRHAERAGRLLHREFDPVVYRRRFKIGDLVDAERISARLVNGVLTLDLPKAEAVKPRKIKVNL